MEIIAAVAALWIVLGAVFWLIGRADLARYPKPPRRPRP